VAWSLEAGAVGVGLAPVGVVPLLVAVEEGSRVGGGIEVAVAPISSDLERERNGGRKREREGGREGERERIRRISPWAMKYQASPLIFQQCVQIRRSSHVRQGPDALVSQ